MRQRGRDRMTRSESGLDFRSVCDRIGDVLEMLRWTVMLPFRLIAAIGNFFVAVGRGLLRWTIQICFGLIGLAFIGFVGFGLIRTIFHPLFV